MLFTNRWDHRNAVPAKVSKNSSTPNYLSLKHLIVNLALIDLCPSEPSFHVKTHLVSTSLWALVLSIIWNVPNSNNWLISPNFFSINSEKCLIKSSLDKSKCVFPFFTFVEPVTPVDWFPCRELLERKTFRFVTISYWLLFYSLDYQTFNFYPKVFRQHRKIRCSKSCSRCDALSGFSIRSYIRL